jgi:hypothetical protein
LAVEVAGVVVVADDDDMVADGEGAVGVPGDFVGAEVALRFAEFAGAEVEVGDVGAAVGEHDRVAIGTGPVVDERLSCLFGGVGDGDPPVFAVGAGEAFDLARAELLKGFAVPRVLLTAAFAQLDGWGLNGEDVEGAAGGDLGRRPASPVCSRGRRRRSRGFAKVVHPQDSCQELSGTGVPGLLLRRGLESGLVVNAIRQADLEVPDDRAQQACREKPWAEGTGRVLAEAR